MSKKKAKKKVIPAPLENQAMDFLYTYGWAILVVLGAIGALAYFGVLVPEVIREDCAEKVCCGLGADFNDGLSTVCCHDSQVDFYGNSQDLGGYSIVCKDAKRVTGMTLGQAKQLCGRLE